MFELVCVMPVNILPWKNEQYFNHLSPKQFLDSFFVIYHNTRDLRENFDVGRRQ